MKFQPLPGDGIEITPTHQIDSLEVARLAAQLYSHVRPHALETRASIAVSEALEILDLAYRAGFTNYADRQG